MLRLLLGLCLVWAVPALAAPLPVVLIVDASGSMAAQIEGEARLDIARKVILDQAAQWVGDSDLALVAYGHRRQGDCTDIETLLPVAPVDIKALKGALDRLRARGKTPLSASLIEAASLLPDGGSIILVSDGLDTCAADPCAVAAALHAANIHVTIHVVGFGLTAPEQQALACIAENGGGMMVSADSAETLSNALAQVGQIAVAQQLAAPAPPEPAAVPATPVPAEPSPPTPMPVGFIAMTSAGPLPAPVAWTVTPIHGDALVYEGAGQGIALDLLPGRYRIKLAGNNVTGGAELDMTGPTDAALPVPIEAGFLQAHLRAGGGLTLADAELPDQIDWTVTPLDGQATVAPLTGLDPHAVLAPGRYAIVASVGIYSARTEATIAVGTVNTVDLSLALGRLSLQLSVDAGAEPLGGTDIAWSIMPNAGGPAVTLATAQPALVLPAGEYSITVTVDGADISTTATVIEGADVLASISLVAGTVTLEATLGPDGPVIDDWRNATWTVTPVNVVGQPQPALTDQAEARPVLTLLPGQWQATLKSGTASVTEAFTVAPGIKQTIRIAQDAGMLRLTGRLVAGAEPFADWRDVLWTVRSADGATTVLDAAPELTPALVLPSGDWVVTLVSGGARFEQTVTLAAGDEVSLDAVLDAGRLSVSLGLPQGAVATLDVSALDAGGNPVAPPLVSAAVSSTFATVLPAGQYVVEATTPDGGFASAPFEVIAGQGQQIDLTFP